jgi:hypothetical protein
MDATSIIKSLEAVTAKWTKQRKQEMRGRAQSRRAVFVRMYRMSIKDAACSVMPAAYAKVSDNGRLPAQARQLMYAARGEILRMTGRQELNSAYFTQTILPEYMVYHHKETAAWDVTYDARGHFAEPHTKVIVPLGTLDVRQYLASMRDHGISPLDFSDLLTPKITRFPTRGPQHRFSAVLFIEKEGFMPLFAAVKLAERFDLAIMSTKGMPVVACRYLADQLCGKHDIPLLVLHDFDKAGFSIARTLSGVDHYDRNCNQRTTRYDYRHNFDVIDLGLRLPDVNEHSLECEPVHYRRSDPSDNLEENGATPEEIEFLCGHHGYGRRVELNAFTSADFIRWIEAKLQANGIKKVIPDAGTLDAACRRAVQIEVVREQLDAIIEKAAEQAAEVKLPKNLDHIVRKGFKADPAQSWDQVIASTAAANCKNRENGRASFQQAKSVAPAQNLTKAPPPSKRPRGRPRKLAAVAPALSLAELGISEKFANQCRAMAAAGDGALDEYAEMVNAREDGQITTEGFLAFCNKRGIRKSDSACSKSTEGDA